MPICSLRMESKITVEAKPGGVRTGLIWWMNDGVTSHESHREVPNGNLSSSAIGDALDATGDRAAARVPAKALNDRAIQAAP